jgi:hypothetical protein
MAVNGEPAGSSDSDVSVAYGRERLKGVDGVAGRGPDSLAIDSALEALDIQGHDAVGDQRKCA